jgi:multidrug transporter EmrE-like cation transporter
MFYFFFTAYFLSKENPLRFLTKPLFFGQSAGQGISGVLESFAYNFAPASLILGTKRASSVAWTVVSGGVYFKEKHLAVKIACLAFIIIGIILFFL